MIVFVTALVPSLDWHAQVIFQDVLTVGLVDVNTCNYNCRSSFSGWTCAGNISTWFNGGMPAVNTCTCDCHCCFTGWTCTGNILVYFINGNIWCQPRNWQWGVVKNESYEKRDDFNFPFICRTIPVESAYEVYISQLIQHSSRVVIWSIYLSVDPIFQ